MPIHFIELFLKPLKVILHLKDQTKEKMVRRIQPKSLSPFLTETWVAKDRFFLKDGLLRKIMEDITNLFPKVLGKSTQKLCSICSLVPHWMFQRPVLAILCFFFSP